MEESHDQGQQEHELEDHDKGRQEHELEGRVTNIWRKNANKMITDLHFFFRIFGVGKSSSLIKKAQEQNAS